MSTDFELIHFFQHIAFEKMQTIEALTATDGHNLVLPF